MLFIPFAALTAMVAFAMSLLVELCFKGLSQHFGGFGIQTTRFGWLLLLSLWWLVSVAISFRVAIAIRVATKFNLLFF